MTRRASVTIAALLSFAAPLTARALTIEAPIQDAGGSAAVLTEVTYSGLFFLPVGEDPGGPLAGQLFPDLHLGQAQVGTTFFADASDGEGFARAVASLTDGLPGVIYFGYPSSGGSPFHTYAGPYESQVFASDPLGTGGVDLSGLRIDRIGFRLGQIALDSPGSNPNGDGVWTDYRVDATLIIEGEPLPEPGAVSLLGLACAVLIARRKPE
jgi:hypothetical protein